MYMNRAGFLSAENSEVIHPRASKVSLRERSPCSLSENDIMKRTLLTLALATGLVTAGAASAQRYYAPAYDYARVVAVDPIVSQRQRPVSREVCYDEPVRYRESGHYDRYDRRGSATPTIAGAIIGGVVGNQFGSGSGRDAATVAGAVLGGSIGRDHSRGRYDDYDRYDRRPASYRGVERRCEVQTAYRGRERVVGYDVTYVYNGRTFHTQTAQHPGRRIRIQVDANRYAYRY